MEISPECRALPFLYGTLRLQLAGVKRDRKMTSASRGHFLSKLYSASCGCNHTKVSLWPQLVLPDFTPSEEIRWFTVWAHFCFSSSLVHFLQTGDTRTDGGGFGQDQVQHGGQLLPPAPAGVGCLPPPPPPLQPARHHRDSKNPPKNTILNSTGFCLFV